MFNGIEIDVIMIFEYSSAQNTDFIFSYKIDISYLWLGKYIKLKTLSTFLEQRQKRKDTTHFVNLCIN